MTAEAAATPATTTWADLDPLLGGLQRVLAGADRVHELRWQPGRRARAAFSGPAGADGAPGGPDAAVVDVTPARSVRTGLADDPGLPGMPALLAPAQVAARLADVLGAPVTSCATTVAAYHPGSRCVLRYRARTAAGEHQLYVKVLAEGLSRTVQAEAALATTARLRGLPRLAPAVLAAWPDVGALVTAAVPGGSLSQALASRGKPVAQRLSLAGDLGRLLGAVHSTPPAAVPGAARAPEPAEVLAEARSCTDAAWHADPVTAASLASLLDDLTTQLPRARVEVLAHGSFRPGQVVCNRDALVVLDLDAVGRGDPAQDVGQALAHLAWQGVRGALGGAAVSALGDALLAGYRGTGADVEDEALAWWQAAAMTKIAARRYRSVAVGEWQRVPGLLAAARRLVDPPLHGAATPRLPRPRHRSRGAGAAAAPELLDPARMTAVLAPVLSPHAPGRGVVTVDTADVVATAPGRRAVVRYRVHGLRREPADVIAKAYAEHERAAITYQNLRRLSAWAGTGPLSVPTPLGVVPERGLVVYGEVPGLALHELPATDAVDASRRVGAGLAGLHRGSTELERRLDVDREVANAATWAEEVSRFDEAVRPLAVRLADLLRGAAAGVPPVQHVPIHKDLHPGHVLVAADGAVTVIDVDEARMGDPAFDVAHLCTYLEELDDGWSAEARSAFLQAYGVVPGEAADERLRLFAAYSRLKLAKQVTRGRPRPWARPGASSTSALLALLERGAACLAA